MKYSDFKAVEKRLSVESWQKAQQSGKIGKQESESAFIRNNNYTNAYSVNLSATNSKAYHDKFENLTANKKINEALYKQAGKILNHRNGTAYEDIAMLDARTGKVLVENDSAKIMFRCGLTIEQYKNLQRLGKNFEILHNHPNSSLPSTSDIIGLFARELATASTIIAHDGTIYRLEKLKPFKNVQKLIDNVYFDVRQIFEGYPENLIESRASEMAVEQLANLKVLKYKVIK